MAGASIGRDLCSEGRIVKQAVYIAIEINMSRKKYVLDMYAG